MDYSIINEGHSVLAIQKDPKWSIPSAQINISFTTNVDDVMRYGPNGLHYLEHVLFNVILYESKGKCTFFRSNAVTFDNGTMMCYFHVSEDELDAGIESFYNALMNVLNPSNYKRYTRFLSTERRRVTTEVSKIYDDGKMSLMFVSNADLYDGSFPREYVWDILLHSCKLEKIAILAHCKTSKDTVKKFTDLAGRFNDAWLKAPSTYVPGKTDKVELVGVFPPSSFIGLQDKVIDAIEVSLRDIPNPIVREIVSTTITGEEMPATPYLYSVILSAKPVGNLSTTLGQPHDTSSQYMWSDFILSSGSDLKEEWIHDMMNMDAKSILKKYGGEAKKEIQKILAQYR